jgi:hypothetical protein
MSMIRITLGDTTYLASRINTTPDNSTYSQVSSNYGSSSKWCLWKR